jgi:hypothetical protein
MSIELSKLRNFQSKSYAYEIWIYVNDVSKTLTYTSTTPVKPTTSDGIKSNIFNVGDCLSLDVFNKGQLRVSTYGSSSSYDKSYEVTQNLELQRWQQVIIGVTNSLLDIYLNGKLINSINTSVATPKNSAKISFGMPDAYIAKFNRLDGAMDTNKAWKRYMEGNIGLVPMHVDLTLTNNTISNKFTIL